MLNEEVKLTNVQTTFNPIMQHLDPDFKLKEKPTAELWMKIYLPWKMGAGGCREQLSREILHINGLTLPAFAAVKMNSI